MATIIEAVRLSGDSLYRGFTVFNQPMLIKGRNMNGKLAVNKRRGKRLQCM